MFSSTTHRRHSCRRSRRRLCRRSSQTVRHTQHHGIIHAYAHTSHAVDHKQHVRACLQVTSRQLKHIIFRGERSVSGIKCVDCADFEVRLRGIESGLPVVEYTHANVQRQSVVRALLAIATYELAWMCRRRCGRVYRGNLCGF